MTAHEILRRVCFGHLLIVGELRAADIREAGQVDTKTGLRATVWLITYFVELMREREFKVAKITRRVPPEVAHPETASVGAEKGKCYVFEIESAEVKHGFLLARMAPVEPALIEAGDAGLLLGAPTGAASGGAA